MDYKFGEIEHKWQTYWREHNIYKVGNDEKKPKFYVLDMFPYPSGSGLHVGHPLGYIASDIYSRFQRMNGFNVLHPMGFDAFGLPAEQYAIQTGQHPAKTTAQNAKRYKEQLNAIGLSYDWSREVTTSDPEYYKWTQWIFLQMFDSWYNTDTDKAEPIDLLVKMFKTKGCSAVNAICNPSDTFSADEWNNMNEEEQQKILLNYRLAYLAYADVNWCPELGTVLANDEVKDGVSVRGGYPVERKAMRQWFLRITAFAERLLNDLEGLDWHESMKDMQRNWIGRSEGASVYFRIEGTDSDVEVFTTRPDTIYGATFIVLAPEHNLVGHITTPEQKEEIDNYLDYVKSRSERERLSEIKTVTGAFTGAHVINPFTKEKMPVWIGEYVLAGYGTGAIMAVPGHDRRDYDFAKKFNLPIIPVIEGTDLSNGANEAREGKMINSGIINGMEVKQAISTIIAKIEELKIGKGKVNYKLRDVNFSRQRYWGEPFPIVYHNGLPKPVPIAELPIKLPDVESYKPTGSGESPLATVYEWVNTFDGAVRETDTMPGFAGSSWYFLRYMDPKNEKTFVSAKAEQYWRDVDMYIGGAEHAVGHLLYARFFQKFLYDMELVSKKEPFRKLVNQGMIQGISEMAYMVKQQVNYIHKFAGDRQTEKLYLNDGKVTVVFVSANIAENYPDDTIQINIEIALVDDYDKSTPSFLTEDGINKFRLSRPDYKEAVFVTSNGYYDEHGFHPFKEGLSREPGKFYTRPEVEKMSKSKYNVVNPDDVIGKYGADTFRMYEMFLGPLEQHKPWDTKGIDGVHRFLKKLWRLFFDEKGNVKITDDEPTPEELKMLHKTIKKVRDDIERLSFNTAVSALMICVNELNAANSSKKAVLEPLTLILSPFAPHLAEELWALLGHNASIINEPFPPHYEKYLVEENYTYPVSINGKLRTKIELPLEMAQPQVEQVILGDEVVLKWTEGKPPKKIIFVKGKIINLVV